MAVVGLHTLKKDLSFVNLILYDTCGFAVPVFFASSGYILLNRDNNSITYSLKKILLILKAVIFWCLLFGGSEIVYSLMRESITINPIVYLVKNILKSLIQRGTMWHFWYFGALIIVYLCLPALSKIRDKLKYVFCFLLIAGCLLQIVSYIAGEPLQKHVIQTFRIWTWLKYFILGGLIGEYTSLSQNTADHRSSQIGSIQVLAATGIAVAYQIVAGKLLLHNTYAEYFYDSVFTTAWTLLLLSFCLKIHLSDQTKNFIKGYAPITMGIYIFHPIVLRVVNHFIVADSLSDTLLLFVTVLILSSGVAFIASKIPFVKEFIRL
jgi:surface polysaccharide O-acyltransferase-like enzyme